MTLRGQAWTANAIVAGGALSWIAALVSRNLWWASISAAVVIGGFLYLWMGIRRATREIQASNARVEKGFNELLQMMQPPAAPEQKPGPPEGGEGGSKQP